jgi:hypothetical protein
MSNNEIPVGSRWRWNGTAEGRFWQVTGHAGESVFMCASDGGSTCTAITSFRNATRIDAPPAVKAPAMVFHFEEGPCRWCPDQPCVHQRVFPEPEKAEAPCIECGRRECRCDDVSKPVPPPARCAPGCTPAAPCRTEGVCPVFAEEVATAMTEVGVWNKGVPADLPPARRHTPPTLRHEGLCIAGWDGRVPRG